MFCLIPADVFVGIDSDLLMLKDTYLAMVDWCNCKMFIACCIILSFTIFFFLFFGTSLKDKVNLEFLLTIKEHKY